MPRAASAVLPLESDVVFASHHWPTFGNSKALTFLSQQRDLYACLHNETLRQLNAGKTGLEIAEDFKLPDSLENLWCSREYYGSVSHNVKAIYSRYMGWFDGNPAHLWEHPPVEAAQRYVNCMGGIEKVIELGVKYREAGYLRFAVTLLNHAVFSDQSNSTATQELTAPVSTFHFSVKFSGLQPVIHPTNFLQNKYRPISHVTRHSIAYQKAHPIPNTPASLTVWPTFQQFVDLVDGQRQDLSGIETSGDLTVWDTLNSLLTSYDTGFAIVSPEES
ncbi:beta-lactamase-like protein [Cadophora sp. MPI-SDFR-AT-0126]|nr:beta-lactamase-like protein [Leotiomycetes sp. MPI-SDFR-AT-0126]